MYEIIPISKEVFQLKKFKDPYAILYLKYNGEEWELRNFKGEFIKHFYGFDITIEELIRIMRLLNTNYILEY